MLTQVSNQVIQQPYRKNFIVNGCMRVAQRGTVALSGVAKYGGPDRHLSILTECTAGNIIQATGDGSWSDDLLPSKKALWLAGISCNANGILAVDHRIESASAKYLSGKTITFSAVIYHTFGSATNFYVCLFKPNVLDTFTAHTVITTSPAISVPSQAWTKITYTYTLGANEAANGLRIQIYATGLTLSSKDIYFGSMQLELGSVATPFEYRPFAEELALCERYYQMSSQGLMGWAESTSRYHINTPFGTKMRTSPIPTILAPAATQLRQGATNSTPTGQSLVSHNSKATGSLVIIDVTGVTLTANAAVVINSVGTYSFGFDAEL